MATDNQVIALYRKGTPAAQEQASGLVVGREIQLFSKISDSIARLVADAQNQSQAAAAQASSAQSTSSTLTLVCAAFALLVAAALAYLLTRSLKRGVALDE